MRDFLGPNEMSMPRRRHYSHLLITHRPIDLTFLKGSAGDAVTYQVILPVFLSIASLYKRGGKYTPLSRFIFLSTHHVINE